MQHFAKLENSPRLQRVLALLRQHAARRDPWVSSLGIIMGANVVAISSCISELRFNGCEIECEQRSKNGQRVWYYRLVKGPEEARG